MSRSEAMVLTEDQKKKYELVSNQLATIIGEKAASLINNRLLAMDKAELIEFKHAMGNLLQASYR